MFAILLSWAIISLVLLSFGDMFLALYNKVNRRKESCNLLDKFILGLCFVIIPLQIWSLWLPANHVFLLICMGISAIYCFFARQRFSETVRRFFSEFRQMPALLAGIIVVFLLLILSSSVWMEGVWDSGFYHYQNIRWCEEYAVVPGLGNLDDRYGFNSNYMLLSAVFSFRFLFGQPLYSLHILFMLLLAIWVFRRLFTVGNKWRGLLLLLAFSLFYFFSLKILFDTSTDLLPNIIVFYLVAKFVMCSSAAKRSTLLYTLPLAFLITCKLSLFFVSLIGIYFLMNLVKGKSYRAISFILIAAILTLVPWMIRNVILSGYLVYPVYQIDLFSFDWKIPREVAILQNAYIYDIGHHFLKAIFAPGDTHFNYPLWQRLLIMIIYILTALSLSLSAFYIIRTKMKDKAFLSFFLALSFTLCQWLIKAPDARFVIGVSCGAIVLCGTVIRHNLLPGKYLKVGTYSLVSSFLIMFFVWSGYRIRDRIYTVSHPKQETEIVPVSRVLYLPYRYEDFLQAREVSVRNFMSPYPLSENIVIKVSSFPIFDEFPAMIESGIGGGQFIDYRCLEARGKTLQDGFRTKEVCEYTD